MNPHCLGQLNADSMLPQPRTMIVCFLTLRMTLVRDNVTMRRIVPSHRIVASLPMLTLNPDLFAP